LLQSTVRQNDREDKDYFIKSFWSGQTRVTAGLTSILANYDAIVLDRQADIHDTLSLGILFEK
jgi:phosphoserine phosphatase